MMWLLNNRERLTITYYAFFALFSVGVVLASSSSSSSSSSDVRSIDVQSNGNYNDNNSILSNHHDDAATVMASSVITTQNITTNPFVYAERFKEFRAKAKEERKQRAKARRHKLDKNKARRVLDKLPKAPEGKIERITESEWKDIQEKQQNNNKEQNNNQQRQLNWFSSSGTGSYSHSILADAGEYYDKWAQAYRMLGGYIDCDHDKSENSHDSGDNNNGENDDSACSRWMLWAAYVNPNYQGNEYYEYFGDNPTSVLDCHKPDSDWELLGVYRQEFYQYIEQISKHLWAIDEYEYVVALAGLSYMTDYDCFQVGNDNSGNAIYAGVAPKPYGKFEMALYTDEYCLEPDDSLGMTYDDFGLQTDIDLGSKDQTDDGFYDEIYSWWYDTQEYTFTQLNDVYEEFKYCTSCVDYPTYQDGYFIGDYGTDDDDLINQCWKFYSHDSFTCEAECIAMAHAQGTILSIKYGESTFGKTMSSFYDAHEVSSSHVGESKFSRLLANVFLTASFILFVATFLAFAVARRSRYRESRSGKSRRLLDDSERRRRRSKSRSEAAGDGDGLFRSSSRSKSRSKSKRRSSSKRSNGYDAPKERPSTSRTKSSRSKSSNGDYF